MVINNVGHFPQIIQYYKKLSLPARAGLWFLVCNFLQKGIVALTTPIFTRIMSTAEYGKVSVYYSWQDILSIFLTFGLSSAVYSRGLVKNEKKQDDYTGVMVTLSTVTTLFALVIYIFFHKVVNYFVGLSVLEILLIFVYTYFNTGLDFWYQKKRVCYQYVPFVVITIFMTMSKPCISILAMYLLPNYKVIARIVSDAAVMFLVGAPIIFSMLKKSKKYFEWTIWKESMIFVVPLIPHFLSQRILNQSDRIMISNLNGDEQTGIYSLAYSIGMLLLFVNNALDSTIGPWTFKKMRDKKYKDIGDLSQSLILFLAMCVLCFGLITPEVVHIFSSSKYYDAIYIVPVIAAGSFFIYLYTQFIYFEYYIGKTYFVSIATLISAFANLILNYIFIQKYGYIAAAYTTLICYILYAIGHFYIMKYLCIKYLKIGSVYNVLYLFSVSMVVILVSIGMPFLYEFLILRRILAFVVIGITLMYALKVMKKFGIGNSE